MYNTAVAVFPIIAFSSAIIILLMKYGFRKDMSGVLVRVSLIVQICTGIFIVYSYINQGEIIVALSYLDYSINFIFDDVRFYFMLTLLVPCVFALFGMQGVESLNMRVVFLLYLSGCSGIIVTGDLFNFFVFFELMIMGAYVLITIKKDYYAGIRYMLIGAISSTVLLSAIILWFAMGNYFNMGYFSTIDESKKQYAVLLIGLFLVAFTIKGGLFPACNWTAVCHAATVSTVSSFLSSFTIFSGIFGIYQFVIVPAEFLKIESVIELLRFVSVLSIVYSSLYVFYEKHFKKMIAGTTVTGTSIVVLMLTYGSYRAAFSYMLIHAIYKSSLFLLYEKRMSANDEVDIRLSITTDPITYGMTIVFFLFTAGIFPAVTYLLKYENTGTQLTYKVIIYLSALLTMSGLFKYGVLFNKFKLSVIHLVSPVLVVLFYLYFPVDFKIKLINIVDLFIVIFAVIGSGFAFRYTPLLHTFERRYVFKNFNFELLYIIALFTGVFTFLSIVHF